MIDGRCRLLLAWTSFVLLCSGWVSAKEVFIAPTGADDAAGTHDAPLATLAKAAAEAGAGGTIHLAAGQYAAADLSGTTGLTLIGTRSAPGDASPADSVVTGNLLLSGGATASNLTFEFKNETADDWAVTVKNGGPVRISACLFRGPGPALKIDSCDHWRIENCVFQQVFSCIGVHDSPHGVLVNNSIIDDRLGHGTSSLTTRRIWLGGEKTDDITLFNNAFCPRDPDSRILLIESAGKTIFSDANLWRGIINYYWGSPQDGAWQTTFRSVQAWQPFAAQTLAPGTDAHSRNELLNYTQLGGGSFVPDVALRCGEYPGKGEGLATFHGAASPTTDFYGRPRAEADIGAFSLDQSVNVAPSFTIELPSARRVSAGVFSAAGKLVRTLTSSQFLPAGKHAFYWDGKDGYGQPAAKDGTYQYRAILADELKEAPDIAAPGMTYPPQKPGVTPLSAQQQENGVGMWCDDEGNLYRVATYDEAGTTILSTDRDGHYRWRTWEHGGEYVSGDEKYIYVIGDQNGDAFKGKTVLERYLHAGTSPVEWTPGALALTLDPPDGLKAAGMAVVGNHLFVSDKPRDRVLVYELGQAALESKFAVASPTGIAPLPNGQLLICSGRKGDRAGALLLVDSTGNVLQTFAGFDDPTSVVIDPRDGTVYVGDGGQGTTQQVIKCHIAPSFGIDAHLGEAGGYTAPQSDAVVRPGKLLNINALAIHGNDLWVGQSEGGYARNRLCRMDLNGQIGLDILNLEGQNGSCADSQDPSQIYSADLFRYDVNLKSGDWAWTRNFHKAREAFIRDQYGCSTCAVIYVGGKKFFAASARNGVAGQSGTVVIYRFAGDDLVPCAAVGGRYYGLNFVSNDAIKGKSGKWIWIDKNLDGVMQDNEMQFVVTAASDSGFPFPDTNWAEFVEKDGTISWPGDAMHYLTPHGLNEQGIPNYDWANAATVAYQHFPQRRDRYVARPETWGDGSINDISATTADPMPPSFWGLGTTLSRLDAKGESCSFRCH